MGCEQPQFSKATMSAIDVLAGDCERAYAWPSRAAFDWKSFLLSLLTNILGGCKPDTPEQSTEMPKKWFVKCSKGVNGCCPKNVRKGMERELGINNATEQDRRFYTTVMTGNQSRDTVAKAIESAKDSVQ